jgi:hypothetical protein
MNQGRVVVYRIRPLLENDELRQHSSAGGRPRMVVQLNLLRETERPENVLARLLEGR